MSAPVLTPGEPERLDVFGGNGLTLVDLAFVLVALVFFYVAAKLFLFGPDRR